MYEIWSIKTTVIWMYTMTVLWIIKTETKTETIKYIFFSWNKRAWLFTSIAWRGAARTFCKTFCFGSTGKKKSWEQHCLIFTQTHPVSGAPPSRLCHRCPSPKHRSAHTAVLPQRRRETWLTAPACPRPEPRPSHCPVPLREPPPGH